MSILTAEVEVLMVMGKKLHSVSGVRVRVRLRSRIENRIRVRLKVHGQTCGL
jgi:hypothetical protein